MASYNPPKYDGATDLVILEDWMKYMDNHFTITKCPENQQDGITSYYLSRQANSWWDTKKN